MTKKKNVVIRKKGYFAFVSGILQEDEKTVYIPGTDEYVSVSELDSVE